VTTAAQHYSFTEYRRPRVPGGQTSAVKKFYQAITRLQSDPTSPPKCSAC